MMKTGMYRLAAMLCHAHKHCATCDAGKEVIAI